MCCRHQYSAGLQASRWAVMRAHRLQPDLRAPPTPAPPLVLAPEIWSREPGLAASGPGHPMERSGVPHWPSPVPPGPGDGASASLRTFRAWLGLSPPSPAWLPLARDTWIHSQGCLKVGGTDCLRRVLDAIPCLAQAGLSLAGGVRPLVLTLHWAGTQDSSLPLHPVPLPLL